MKILLISPLPPPVGGIASWSQGVLNFHSVNQDSYEIIHQNSCLKYKEETREDFNYRIFTGVKEFRSVYSELKINIEKHRPDVIHITSSASFALIKDFFLLNLAKRNKIPVIIHLHFGRIPELAANHNWEWKLLSHIIKKSFITIVIDAKSYKTLLNEGFCNSLHIPNPTNCEIDKKLQSEYQSLYKKKKGQILFVGYIIRDKGVFELVEACSNNRLVDELILIGPYHEKIRKELSLITKRRENGSWCKLLGTLPNEKVLEFMRTSPVLALPSYTEGFPTVIIEGMAMRCAIVATDVGAIPEMLAISSDKPCGMCVPAGDVAELRDAIQRLSENPDEVRMMGNNGLDRVMKNYTLCEVVNQYKSVWKEAYSG